MLIGIQNGWFTYDTGDRVKVPNGIGVSVDQSTRRVFLQFPQSPAVLVVKSDDKPGHVYCGLRQFLLHHGIMVNGVA